MTENGEPKQITVWPIGDNPRVFVGTYVRVSPTLILIADIHGSEALVNTAACVMVTEDDLSADQEEGGLRPALAHLKAYWTWQQGQANDRMMAEQEGTPACLGYAGQVTTLDTCIRGLDTAVDECGMRLPEEETEEIIKAHRADWSGTGREALRSEKEARAGE